MMDKVDGLPSSPGDPQQGQASPASVPLTYGKAPRRSRWGWLGLLIAVIAIGGIAWQKGWLNRAKDAWRYYQANAPYRAAMAFDFPSRGVLWDAASPPVGAPAGTPLRTLSLLGDTVLFMHGRETSAGVRKLVTISFVQPRSGVGQHLAWTLFEAGMFDKWPRHHGPDLGLDLGTLPATPTRFYAGQPDPADKSHFMIDCDTPAGRYTIHGWLIDTPSPSWDPIGVRMEVRSANTK